MSNKQVGKGMHQKIEDSYCASKAKDSLKCECSI